LVSLQSSQCPERLSGADVNEALIPQVVAWLQKIVPDAIEVSSVTPGSVLIRAFQGPELAIQDVGSVLGQCGVAAPDAIRLAFDSLLATVQDFVCEELTVPWPEVKGVGIPEPRVVVSSGTVIAGYATSERWVAHTPTLRFDELPA